VLKSDGRVFLIDNASVGDPRHTVCASGEVARRSLSGGGEFEIVKRFWTPAELEAELDLEAAAPGIGAPSGTITEQALRQLERGGAFNLDDTLKAWERGYIEAALRLTRGNVSQAAKLLGINRTTLYSRMQTGDMRTEEK
jgi:DNA-binding NtrC family response regulator